MALGHVRNPADLAHGCEVWLQCQNGLRCPSGNSSSLPPQRYRVRSPKTLQNPQASTTSRNRPWFFRLPRSSGKGNYCRNAGQRARAFMNCARGGAIPGSKSQFRDAGMCCKPKAIEPWEGNMQNKAEKAGQFRPAFSLGWNDAVTSPRPDSPVLDAGLPH